MSNSDWSDYWQACPQIECSDARRCEGYQSPPWGCLVPPVVQRHYAREPMPVTKENLKDAMSYHTLDDDQKKAYARIEAAAVAFAEVALDVLPPCGDQQAGIRHIFEAKATLNRGVAIKGAV